MKKYLLFFMILILLVGCENKIPKAPIVLKTESLMEKYPNFKSNDIARDSIKANISNYSLSFIGKEAPFENIEFTFKRIIENEQKGTKAALFESKYTYATIDNPNEKGKYIGTNIQIGVLGTVDDELALKLDGSNSYYISGIVHAVDEKDPFYISDSVMGLYFGTFIMDEMSVNQVKQ